MSKAKLERSDQNKEKSWLTDKKKVEWRCGWGSRDKLGNQEMNFDSNDPGKGLGESTMTICVEQVQCTILHRAPAENLIRIQEEE